MHLDYDVRSMQKQTAPLQRFPAGDFSSPPATSGLMEDVTKASREISVYS